jgi:hypothetical protein
MEKTFKKICGYRYAYAAKVSERRKLENIYKISKSLPEKKRIKRKLDNLNASFYTPYADLPDSTLENYSLFDRNTKACDVDYDRIVFDTYDYLDKLIGFKLSDIFYAIFYQYHQKTQDNRALILSKYFKYGTDNEKEILMLRYGLTFEDIEWAKDYVTHISEEEIIFSSTIKELSADKRQVIDRFIN